MVMADTQLSAPLCNHLMDHRHLRTENQKELSPSNSYKKSSLEVLALNNNESLEFFSSRAVKCCLTHIVMGDESSYESAK